MSWLSSVLSPVLVSAGVSAIVSVGIHWWFQRARPDLRCEVGSPSVDDSNRLLRGNRGDGNMGNHPYWLPLAFIRLTNYGDGAAYDVRLSSTRECKPRVWVGDSGVSPMAGEPAEIAYPLWSDTIAAMEPGVTVNVLLMGSPDQSRDKPVLTVTWPRLPGRRFGGRTTLSYDLANARRIEEGWPGEPFK